MGNRVYVFDTTLRDGEQSPGVTLNVHEKLEIGRQLIKLGVDIIEAGFPVSSPGDFNSCQALARELKGVGICGLSRANSKDIDVAAEAIKDAEAPRIHTGLGVSDFHLKHKLRMTPDEALETGVAAVKHARKYVSDIEYYLEDSGRADPEYVYRVIEAVIKAGATVINIPDTTGYSLPKEYGELIAGIFANVPNVDKAIISVHCHNDLGMATANCLSGVHNGARQVEVTVNGIGERAGNTSLEEVVMALRTRRDSFTCDTHIKTEEIIRSSRLVSHLSGMVVQPNKAIVGSNAFAHSSGIHQDGMLKERSTYEIMDPRSVGLVETKMVLTARSGRHGVRHSFAQLGYTFTKEEFEEVYHKYLEIADRKKQVYEQDLEAIATDQGLSVIKAYELVLINVTSGQPTVPVAAIQLKKADGTLVTETATGIGSVDATYTAINKISGLNIELLEYGLNSVTAGIDAVAEVNVRVRYGKDIFSGHGIHTDIVVASAYAYLSVLNRVCMQTSGLQVKLESP
ncbi:MAG: 2-isopropylmalate synthase [bacterium]